MTDKAPEEKPDDEVLRGWMESVAGSVYLGASLLKSVKKSKDGDKITIVLKKKKLKKSADPN